MLISAPVIAPLPIPVTTPIKQRVVLVREAQKIFDFMAGTDLSLTEQLVIAAFLQTGTRLGACRDVGVDPRVVTTLLRKNKEFAELWREAEMLIADMLEERAMGMALEGSEKMMQTVLKAWKPEKYAEKRITKSKVDVTIRSWAELARQVSIGGEEEENEDAE